jgi:flagellar hook-length control protein FliK
LLNLDDPIEALLNETQRGSSITNEFKIHEESFAYAKDNRSEMNLNFQNKVAFAKETVNKLAEDLKERLKEYKPPIMKMQLQLKPVNLGNIDVTVLSRGGSLHLQLNASSQVLQMFNNHADQLKDALMNVGFGDVSMNFNSSSDNGQSGSNNQEQQESNQNGFLGNSKRKNLDSNGIEVANNPEKTDSIEIILPRYV